jgi:hypothetical protein
MFGYNRAASLPAHTRNSELSYYYTKLDASITDSTVWREPHTTRITWITMLAMADKRGRVWASIPGLADRARVTIEECEAALASFLAPDPYSRTPDHEGRRIEKIDGGWWLINYTKKRNAVDEEYQRERHAKNQAAYRERETGKVTGSDRVTDHVTECDPKHKHKQKQKQKQIESTSTPLASSDESLPAEASPNALLTLPLNDGTSHGVTEHDVEEWKSIYPAVDVMQELRNMKGWLIANPSNRKTPKGVMRFINGWLAKQQNTAPRGRQNRPSSNAPFSEVDYAASYGLAPGTNVGRL